MNLETDLPFLLPHAIEWANRMAFAVSQHGLRVTPPLEGIARRVGVRRPESIRIGLVDQLPFPEHPLLQAAATQTGLLGPNMIGLTLGYAVFIRRGNEGNDRLFSHEFRHVRQYEAAGSIASFLPIYLQSVVAFGYEDSPYEVDARVHEVNVA